MVQWVPLEVLPVSSLHQQLYHPNRHPSTTGMWAARGTESSTDFGSTALKGLIMDQLDKKSTVIDIHTGTVMRQFFQVLKL